MFPIYLTLVLMLLLILAVVGTSIYEMVDEYLDRREEKATMREALLRHWAANNTLWSDISINHYIWVMREQKEQLAYRHADASAAGGWDAHRAIAYCECHIARDYRATKLALKR